ncbi:MAG: hypothetical protein ACRDUW_18255 [Pseudonocardiaceae bacterium]
MQQPALRDVFGEVFQFIVVSSAKSWVDLFEFGQVRISTPSCSFRMVDELRANGNLVDSLGSAVRHGGAELADVPGLLRRVLERDAWRTDLVSNPHKVGRPATGTKAQALRRLRKDAPELHAQVLAGNLTAHAAMIQAGYRHRTVTIRVDDPQSIARTLKRAVKPWSPRKMSEKCWRKKWERSVAQDRHRQSMEGYSGGRVEVQADYS